MKNLLVHFGSKKALDDWLGALGMANVCVGVAYLGFAALLVLYCSALPVCSSSSFFPWSYNKTVCFSSNECIFFKFTFECLNNLYPKEGANFSWNIEQYFQVYLFLAKFQSCCNLMQKHNSNSAYVMWMLINSSLHLRCSFREELRLLLKESNQLKFMLFYLWYSQIKLRLSILKVNLKWKIKTNCL